MGAAQGANEGKGSRRVDLFDSHAIDPVDGLGPLRGVLTALENARTSTVCVITIDMPGVTRESLRWLARGLNAAPMLQGVMCRVSSEGQEMSEPFPSALRTTASKLLDQRLQLGYRSMRSLCYGTSFASLVPPSDWPEETWLNLNHTEELAAFNAALKKSGPPTGAQHEA
jgi:molybdopterin-guanine dinucleotide biosynthesis protein A